MSIELVESAQKNKKGESALEEGQVCKLKMTCDIIHPNYLFIAGEAGENIPPPQGNIWIRGTQLLCIRASVLKIVTLNQENHFASLGFAALIGKLVMCFLIFSHANYNPQVETSLDFAKEEIISIDNLIFFKNNFGLGKALSGRQSHDFWGICALFYLVV